VNCELYEIPKVQWFGILEFWVSEEFITSRIPRFQTLGILEFEELITSEFLRWRATEEGVEYWNIGFSGILEFGGFEAKSKEFDTSKFQDSKGLTETTKAPRVDLRRVKNCAKGSISNQVIGHLVFVFKTVLTEVDHIERQVYETFRILARTRKSSTSRP
jgi:hypothetical protein